EPFIQHRKQIGNVNLMTFEEFYAELRPEERAFAESIRALSNLPESSQKTLSPEDFVKIDGQILRLPDPVNPDKKIISVIERQFLPKNVYNAYLKMMSAMRKDIGRKLLIESGYRSSAYQLYLFVYYLKNHEYSVQETNRWVALPGLSEHNRPEVEAIDFISEEGVSGENQPEDFEHLPQYDWLLANANRFGFVLSYPRNNTTNSAFEPWHWRYEPREAHLVKREA
ncbi:MAG: M15 family metallopeptidase, partial [Candidatus Omnitrophica bacterium]|nr:M15 family metallopeptidase [Candidatus Omnitrophota bacterium]